MVTTIQISEDLKDRLALRKMSSKDRYEDVIWDLLEDTMELNEQTKKEIALAEQEFRKGQTISHVELKKKLGI